MNDRVTIDEVRLEDTRRFREGTTPRSLAKPLTLDDIRSVDAFRDRMLRKLEANIHKGNREGWMPPRFDSFEALRRLFEEAIELMQLLAPDASPDPQHIIDEAADVANLAMMIADQTGELRP